ncbi:LuxR family transcriptional regulator [Rhodobacteraceae bacterium M382]|nr:LuxR family transcriptional regulator [Rhodobacteraceae bacterium M382]
MEPIFFSVLSGLSDQGFSIGVGFSNNEPKWVHSTYAKEWVDTYVEKRFLNFDPTIIHGQKRCGHFTWSELDAKYPDNPVFREAAKFGLSEGNTLSLNICGSRTIVSCAGRKWNADDVRKAKAAASALHCLQASEPYPVVATDKELDVLDLMASGLHDREISERLGIKLESVRMRRRRVYEKTGTTSPASVISFAIKNCWI